MIHRQNGAPLRHSRGLQPRCRSNRIVSASPCRGAEFTFRRTRVSSWPRTKNGTGRMACAPSPNDSTLSVSSCQPSRWQRTGSAGSSEDALTCRLLARFPVLRACMSPRILDPSRRNVRPELTYAAGPAAVVASRARQTIGTIPGTRPMLQRVSCGDICILDRLRANTLQLLFGFRRQPKMTSNPRHPRDMDFGIETEDQTISGETLLCVLGCGLPGALSHMNENSTLTGTSQLRNGGIAQQARELVPVRDGTFSSSRQELRADHGGIDARMPAQR
jgi:hypothetical protein